MRKGGEEFKVESTITATNRGGGARFNKFIRDLTEKTAMESLLRQTQKMEAIGTLTGGLAHDFNNILAIVVGNLDLMIDGLRSDRQLLGLATAALSAAERGADLTRRLLAFARQQPLAPQVVQVNELVRGIVILLRRVLGESIEISLALAPDLWPVVIDPAQLEAALTNLATNARDAMPRGGTLHIATHNRSLDAANTAVGADLAVGDYVMIEVTDSGSGMDEEVRKRIFEPFFTTKEIGKGSGLGLSMVFGFVKQSGGHIGLDSSEGVGTTFRLFLPRATGSALSEAARPAVSAPAAGAGGNETVLVVEDNSDLRKVVRNQLITLGYKVCEAENGKAALAILEAQPVDLLFTDVVMPGGMSGPDLAREAGRRWPAMKVLLTSGFPDTKLEEVESAQRGWRLLVKPYRHAELDRAIRDALGHGR